MTTLADAKAAIERALNGNPKPEDAHTLAIYAEALRREMTGYAESLDAVRLALGQEVTHHLVMHDDVKNVVDALEKYAGGRDDSGALARAALSDIRKK